VSLDFSKLGGLVTAVTVDADHGEVLMVAYMNEEAFDLTLETGRVHYFSRSRNQLWKKGESSGNMQLVQEVRVDCDQDAVLIRAKQTGPACHNGYRSCFYRTVDENRRLQCNARRLVDPKLMYGGNS
jgi:phosphoribosyl-AMP cyclohydrolase